MLVYFPSVFVALLLTSVVYVYIHSLVRRRAPQQSKNILRIPRRDAFAHRKSCGPFTFAISPRAEKHAFSMIEAGDCEVY